jgi:LacI family transcriptional regulator
MHTTPLTLKDIARQLQLSVSTVSRALKNSREISEETRQLVQEYARQHNYKPNMLALSLRMQHTSTVGVIVPELANNFFSSVLSGIETVADRNGYNVVVCQSNETMEKEQRNVQTLIHAKVCGILVSMSKSTTEHRHFQEIIDAGIPLVFFDRICPAIHSDKVVADDYSGTLHAVDYMIETGCRRIAFFSAPPHLEISKNRRNGYLDALRKHRIDIDESLMLLADSKADGYRKAISLLESPQPPDGFMAMNDYTASGILLAAKELKLRVPHDLSICGFSNSRISEDTDPMLTTIDQRPEEVGQAAMTILLAKIQNPAEDKRMKKIIKTSLIVRGTTR